MTMTIEDWKKKGVIWNEDGSASITLTHPINVGGVKSAKVQMHCPSLDQLEIIAAADKAASAAAAAAPLGAEKKNMSSLMGLTPEELGQVKAPDYRRLQMVYADFLAGTPPTFIGAEFAPRSDS